MKKKVLSVSLAVCCVCMIIGFTLQTGEASAEESGRIAAFVARLLGIRQLQTLELIIRKLAHFSEYTLLGLLLSWVFRSFHQRPWLSPVSGLVVACCDELIQRFVPGRGPSPIDVLIDFCGVLAGTALVLAIVHIRRKRSRCTHENA